jgi:hypothetical protein
MTSSFSYIPVCNAVSRALIFSFILIPAIIRSSTRRQPPALLSGFLCRGCEYAKTAYSRVSGSFCACRGSRPAGGRRQPIVR